MFGLFRRILMQKHIANARYYIQQHYIHTRRLSKQRTNSNTSAENDITVNQAKRTDNATEDIRYSEKNIYQSKEEHELSYEIRKRIPKKETDKELYNASAITDLLRHYSAFDNPAQIIRSLEKTVNQTFVERMLYHIKEKNLRDSSVYKAAQIDRRLFSKMVSNYEYKPSKDTAVAVSLALKLSTDEASDLLSRAGYTLSHSNIRDVIIEYFFTEGIYNVADANCILHSLGQKLIGRI